MLHKYSIIIASAVLGWMLMACEGDYRPVASGGYSEVVVVMDSTFAAQGETVTAIRHTFGAPILTMPRPEPRFDLVFRQLRTTRDRDIMQGHKNVIIAAVLDEDTNVGALVRSMLGENVKESVRQGESFSFPQRNIWARDQWVLILTANSDEELAEKIKRNERRLMSDLYEVERQRWHDFVYRRAEQVEKSQDVLERHGWTFRIQHDYRVGVDTLNFMTFRRYLHDNDRWIWVWWQDDVESFDEVDREWINIQRDSLNKAYMQGTTEGRFVRTDYNRPMEQRFMELNGMEAYETRGLWRMENDLMGGPFINYTFYDPEHQRLYMMEFGQHAPRWDQRRFLYQFEAMARTFVSDLDAKKSEEEHPS